jgi:putative transposase
MKYDPAIHRRRSIRLKGYDYSRNGAYFITLCTQDRRCFLGRVVDGEMRLNDAGIMAFQWYRELENKFSDIKCDTFVCMPNHVHFVVVNVSDNAIGGGHTGPQKQGGHTGPRKQGEHTGSRKQGEHTGSPLRRVVQWFKTMSTNEYIRGVKQCGWPPFPGKLWQRNYWEHVIRNVTEFNRIREYIQNNPAKWASDMLNPRFRRRGGPVCPPALPGPVCPPRMVREPVEQYGEEEWMV